MLRCATEKSARHSRPNLAESGPNSAGIGRLRPPTRPNQALASPVEMLAKCAQNLGGVGQRWSRSEVRACCRCLVSALSMFVLRALAGQWHLEQSGVGSFSKVRQGAKIANCKLTRCHSARCQRLHNALLVRGHSQGVGAMTKPIWALYRGLV